MNKVKIKVPHPIFLVFVFFPEIMVSVSIILIIYAILK